MRIILGLLLLIGLQSPLPGLAQDDDEPSLTVEGIVYGIDMKPGKGLFKKNPEFYLEGGLDNVTVTVAYGDSVQNGITQPNGKFRLVLPRGQLIKVGFSKHSYQAVAILFDTRGIPDELWSARPLFSDLELIMRRLGDIPLDIVDNLGRLYYNSSKGQLDFAISANREIKEFETDNALVLMKRAIERNRTLASLELKGQSPIYETEIRVTQPRVARTRVVRVPDTLTIKSEFDLKLLGGEARFGEAEIADRQKAIEEARIRLELDKLEAITVSDSLLLLYRSNQILAAEEEIKSAQRLIESQKSQISSQEESVKFLALTLSLLLILAAVAFIFYRDKLRVNRILKTKNQRIFESLNYAQRIQQAILRPESEIRRYLPNSFVFHKPRDIVSGDFYWFSELEGKLVIAVVDCTGHGVPGAFMSLIGNTLMNEIVLEKRILDPAAVLERLDDGVRESLHQNGSSNVSQDGMEMSICILDPKNRKVICAGAVVPIYIVDQNHVEVLKGTSRSIGGNLRLNGRKKRVSFNSHEFQMNNGAEVFMFTDGFMDQFGGPDHSKFSSHRFKKLLLEVQQVSVTDQKQRLDQAFDQWKGEAAQTDDTLIMGFKF